MDRNRQLLINLLIAFIITLFLTGIFFGIDYMEESKYQYVMGSRIEWAPWASIFTALFALFGAFIATFWLKRG